MRLLPVLLLGACAHDAFGQACPAGGTIDLTYRVYTEECQEVVTEARCVAWWSGREGGDDMMTHVLEVDGRCVERTQWFSDAEYLADPRVLAYGADGCGLEREAALRHSRMNAATKKPLSSLHYRREPVPGFVPDMRSSRGPAPPPS